MEEVVIEHLIEKDATEMKNRMRRHGLGRSEVQPHLDKLWAAKKQRQSEKAIKAMMKAGAHVDDKGDYAYTALMLCAMKGFKESMSFLIAQGARVDERSDIEQTALMLAAACDQLGSVEALLAAGADAFVENCRGLTPKKLMEGAIENVPEKVDRMCRLEVYGEKVSIRQSMGEPAAVEKKSGESRRRL